MWTRIGATPATLTMSQWTTPSVIPPATPASIALPPAARTRAAASDASGWPAATAQRVPITCGAEVGVWLGALCWELTESRLMAGMILARTHAAQGPLLGLSVINPPLIGGSTAGPLAAYPQRAGVNAA